MAFDYQKFKTEFRAAAARHGVDAQTGATSFQVSIIKAEREKSRVAAAATDWWRRADLWIEPGRYHSETEARALQNILQQAQPARALGLTLFDLREVIRQAVEELEAAPLREIHRRRGVQIAWIADGASGRIAVEVPIKIPA